MSVLSRTVTGSGTINAARSACVKKLLNIGLYSDGDGYLSGIEKSVLKNSPEDPHVITALNKYGIDITEYKESFNNHLPFLKKDGRPIPADVNMIASKSKFTQAFVDKLHADVFYSIHLRVDPLDVVKPPSLKRKTTSSHGERLDTITYLLILSSSLETDSFREEQQRKMTVKQRNAKKNADALVIHDERTSRSRRVASTR